MAPTFRCSGRCKRLGLALTTGYTFKHVRTADNQLATSGTDQPVVNVASLDLGVVRDRRDNPLRPRAGLQARPAGRVGQHAGWAAKWSTSKLSLGASYHTAGAKGAGFMPASRMAS
jgi:outer membrane protein assembly factor BamA